MPIYEFYCAACDKKFEKLVLKRDQEVKCQTCENTDVRRLISSCNFGSSDGSVRSTAESSSCSSCSSTNCSTCGSH